MIFENSLPKGKISGIRQMGHWPPILNPYRQPLLTNVTNLYLLAVTETKRCYVTIKHLNLNFPQQCNLKVYSRWLWIFLSLKSPEEWEITKQACRDESVVFFLLPIFIYIYIWAFYNFFRTEQSYTIFISFLDCRNCTPFHPGSFMRSFFSSDRCWIEKFSQ